MGSRKVVVGSSGWMISVFISDKLLDKRSGAYRNVTKQNNNNEVGNKIASL
jgi:hypothetical protein